MNFQLQKNERLHSQKLIKELFDKGSSFFLYPFKVIHLDLEEAITGTNQVLFSVSKRKVKKAVHRNLIKRRMKEAYRLNKQVSAVLKGKGKLIALIYVTSDALEFALIQQKIKKILAKLQDPI